MEHSVTIIIPVHNAKTTITSALQSLEQQSQTINEIIIINDNSDDNSLDIINSFLLTSSLKQKTKIINHPETFGLAASYNTGIENAKGDLVITFHQDILLQKDAVFNLLQPFDDPEVVASYHISIYPLHIWLQNNFWQKCYFSRSVDKPMSGLDGKFDCFRKAALLQVSKFNTNKFFRAGEDGDMVIRLKKIGKVVPTKATIIHLHEVNLRFNPSKIIYKHAQMANCQGAFLRNHHILSIRWFFEAFFREILIITLIVPYIRIVTIIMIIVYSFLYTQKVYVYESRNPRLLLLPFFNIYLLFISIFYSAKGFISGKQTV